MKRQPPAVICIPFDDIHDAAENVADELNQDLRGELDEPSLYSTEQVQRGIYAWLSRHIEDILEDLERNFTDTEDYRKFLGAPELSKAEIARDEAADMAFETARDWQMEAT